jgi:putative phosphoribosyl transferase
MVNPGRIMDESPVVSKPLIPERFPYFADRIEAGRKLAVALEGLRWQNPLILAIPPGGVEVGFEVAKALVADYSLIGVRTLPSPWGQRLPFGAVAEDGSTYLRVKQAKEIPADMVDSIIREQLQGIQGSIRALRNEMDLPGISGRHVVLIDDCLIVGSTMKAALLMCRKQYASRVTVAVPVSGKKEMEEISWLADEAVALENADSLYGPVQIYANPSRLSDENVLDILKSWGRP